MQDRPNRLALLQAIARFVNEEARPALTDPRLNFRALIAANLATIVASELTSEDAHVTAELARANALLGDTSMPLPHRVEGRTRLLAETNRRLARLLREGAPSAEDLVRIHDHLMQTLREKLSVDNPRFDTSFEIE
jgi:hypothetical protein